MVARRHAVASDARSSRPASIGLRARDCSSMGDAMQIKVSKSKAIERLSALRDAVEGLRSAHAESSEFLRWHNDLKGALKYVFGAKSIEMTDFSQIWYWPVVSGPDEAENRRERREAYVRGLDRVHEFVSSQIKQIELFWEDENDQIPVGEADGRSASIDSNQVFIVHGRDQGALAEVKLVLIQLGLEPVILQELPDQGRTIIEKFEDHSHVGFAVVLCTPDDDGGLASEDAERLPRARQNVVFEWGFFIGKLGRDKVCALIKGHVEIPSDYSGVLYVEMDERGAWRLDLAKELNEAQYVVDLNNLQ